MSIKTIGQQAEEVAAEYLERQGYKVITRNWKQPDCEIDIVAVDKSTGCYCFVEVKYRNHARQGGGLDYITRDKFKRMEYSARRYIKHIGFEGGYNLGAIEVAGSEMRVTNFVDQAIL